MSDDHALDEINRLLEEQRRKEAEWARIDREQERKARGSKLHRPDETDEEWERQWQFDFERSAEEWERWN